MKSSTKIAKEYYCDICHYKCNKKDSITKHFLTDKHTLQSKSSQKIADEYKCDICNYVSKKESNYNKHLTTNKHITKEHVLHNNIDITLCECGKKYNNLKSLYYHKKKCIRGAPPSAENNASTDEKTNTMNMIMEELKNMMTENKEFKTMLAEQNKVIQEIANNKPYNMK